MRNQLIIGIIALTGLIPVNCYSQNPPGDSLDLPKSDSASKWSFYGEADYYAFPAEPDILLGIAMANKDIWHVEARYNYEERNTASLFGGLNFTFGNQLQLVLTPMAGIVFGNLNGAAPGLETDLSYKIFNFNSQSEWVFDFSGKEGNFFYSFNQLGVTVFDRIGLGITAQRTRLFKTSLDLQRGFYVQYAFWKLNAGISYFNPFSTDYFFMAMLSIDF
jgi:hypothetical protein